MSGAPATRRTALKRLNLNAMWLYAPVETAVPDIAAKGFEALVICFGPNVKIQK
ncbi:hypothetical protein [Shinella sp. G-2]|uniref:hypothetical protein n=1 Tax=Shinella sp. G-2 TaxID=3133141 RepID=UPI003D05C4EE